MVCLLLLALQDNKKIRMNVVVTGASRGIGLEVSSVFAAAGYNLFLTARNDQTLRESVNDLKKQFPAVGINARSFDLGDKSGARNFAAWVDAEADTVDILVNNAGTFVPGKISEEEEGALEHMISVNLYSAYHVTRGLLPKMKKQGKGHIFTICSIASLQAYPNGGAYSISKFALLGFTRNLRRELMEDNIKVTAVIPGAVYTDSWKGSGVKESRIMKPSDIATLIFTNSRLSPQATVEEIIIRPQLGDL